MAESAPEQGRQTAASPGAARNRNELWARVLLDELARAGVRDLVLAPGSRSTPLVLAAAADGRFRMRVQIDERSAAFLALGMGKATGVPAAVITTSGTAVANLLPAVVEAHQAETPLLLLTADRPPRLRGADANQTIEQVGIFGSYLRLFAELSPADLSEETLRHLRSVAVRAVAAARGEPGGAVHLNFPFDTPLEPTAVEESLPMDLAVGRTTGSGGRPGGAPWTVIFPRRITPDREAIRILREALGSARRPILIAGILPRPWESGPSLARSAEMLGIPLFADALSGSRFAKGIANDMGESNEAEGGVLVGGYDILLRNPELREKLRPDLILRVGSAPVSALMTEWVSEMEDVSHILIDGGGRWKDHMGAATVLIPSDPALLLEAVATGEEVTPNLDPEWVPAWRRVGKAVEVSLREMAARPLFEGGVLKELGDRIPAGGILFLSNSMPVRDFDTFVPRGEKAFVVLGNRGASGIDGIVSTAVGVSIASEKKVAAVVGDLAFLHDANGLASLRDPEANLLLVVVNNDGGGIFHFLPLREEEAFTPLFATPHGRDLGHFAVLHDLAYIKVDLRGKWGTDEGRGIERLREGLEGGLLSRGNVLLEILTDRGENRERRSHFVRETATRVGEALARDLPGGG